MTVTFAKYDYTVCREMGIKYHLTHKYNVLVDCTNTPRHVGRERRCTPCDKGHVSYNLSRATTVCIENDCELRI